MSRRIISGLGWTTASSIMRNVVALLQIAILTRFLDKADFGIVAIANMFVAFTTLFLDMGVSAGIIHKQNISKSEYSSLFWLNILFGVGLTALLFFLVPFITSQYPSDNLAKVVRLICFTILFSALGAQQRTYCQKMTYFKRMSIIDTFSSIVTFVVALVTAIKGCGVYSLAYSTLAGSFALNLAYYIVGLVKDSKIVFHFSFRETIPFLKIGIYQVGSSILDFFTRELDIIIVSYTLGLEFLGVYDIAKRVPTSLFTFILPIVNRVFAPILAEVNENKIVLKKMYIKLAKTMSWVSFPMYMLLAAISPTILTIIFGLEYIDGVFVMMIFSLKYAFSGVNTICGALQVATGRTDIGLKWTVYSIFSTALVYYVSAQWGIGVFLFSMLVLIFINVLILWIIQFKPMVDISWGGYLSIFYRSFIICLLLSMLIYLIYNQSSIVYVVCASIVYLFLYIFIIINSKDGKNILDMVSSISIPNTIKVFLLKLRMVS